MFLIIKVYTIDKNIKVTFCLKSKTSEKMTKFKIKSRSEIGQDFPGSTVVKNPPANAGDTGPSPGPGRSHMLQSN